MGWWRVLYAGGICAKHGPSSYASTRIAHCKRLVRKLAHRYKLQSEQGKAMAYDLEFEKPLAELEKKIIALQRKGDRLKPDEHRQLEEEERELHRRTEEIYKNLSSWETVQVARHKDRPYSADYIHLICEDFFELHVDRSFSDAHAIIAVPAKLRHAHIIHICHQKGRDMQEKQFLNLGMQHPEGDRDAGRLMQPSAKLGFPITSVHYTPGAL